MTDNQLRSAFEHRLKMEPKFEPDMLARLENGEYELLSINAAWEGFMMGVEWAQAQRRKD